MEGWTRHKLCDICLSITDGDHQAPPKADSGIYLQKKENRTMQPPFCLVRTPMSTAVFQAKFLEKWGTGVSRIIEVCREHAVQEPEWANEHGRVPLRSTELTTK